MIDNGQNDEYLYQLLVLTGQRQDAGTRSRVHPLSSMLIIHPSIFFVQIYFNLSGDENDTTIRRLMTAEQPSQQYFRNGNIDAFLLSTPRSLGSLNHLHLWHDNSGADASASWFLKSIIVRDLQTDEFFYFIAQRWFAVEKDDGKVRERDITSLHPRHPSPVDRTSAARGQ